jgi:putative SOS response-associated peptidase YedK
MCGRYVTVSEIKVIEKKFKVTAPNADKYYPNTNVSAGELGPVITSENPDVLQFYQFGYSPSWAKKQFYMINARSEGDHNKENDPNYSGAKGIISKPMFRNSIRSKRCLVVADAFIEGPQKEKLSKPYCVFLRDQKRPFAFAGIWDEWVDPNSGEIIPNFAIITTRSNAVTQALGHHRSPVILDEENYDVWLDVSRPLSDVTELLEPYPAKHMNAYPIDTGIKNPRSNGLALLQPIGERVMKEYSFQFLEHIKLEGMGMSSARRRKLGEQGSLF